MLKKANDMVDRSGSGNRKNPILRMAVGYSVLWLLLCLLLTSVLGRMYMEKKAAETEKSLNDKFQDTMRDFEVKASRPDFRFADNKDYFTYKMAMLEDRLEIISEHPYGLFQTQLFDADAIDDIYYREITGHRFTYNDPQGALAQINKNTVNLRDNDTVILEAYYAEDKKGDYLNWDECDLIWGSCSADYYQIVLDEIERLRSEGYEVGKRAESRLTSLREFSIFDWNLASWIESGLGDDDQNGYSPETEEFYINEEHSFIPKTVVIWYKDPKEEKYHAKRVSCYEGGCPDGYRYIKTGVSATIIPQYPEGHCSFVSEKDLLSKGAENYGNRLTYAYWDRMAKALYLDPGNSACFSADLIEPKWVTGKKPKSNTYDIFYSWYKENFDKPHIDRSKNSFAYAVRHDGTTSDEPNYGRSKPFAYFSGDLYVNYYNCVNNEYTGEQIRVLISCVLPGANRWLAKEFLAGMIWAYLGILLFFALLGWRNYRRLYSNNAKSQFYKSLVNSMAHDLKSPLMVMQGYCENLKENVHTEKKDYYADQVLSNIQYLNTLMDKNLYYARKRELPAEEENDTCIFLSNLVEASVERNHDLLENKNIKVLLAGETLLRGDTETLGLVVENLIGNAIKYSPAGGEIEITASDFGFSVSNTATLSYGKSLQQLLIPLEMGDESRAAGQGTGLGLSIANGIMQGYGGRLKLSYDKETKRFTCLVKIGRARYKRTAE